MARIRVAKSNPLSPALRAKIEELRSHIARVTPRDSIERYKIGVVVRALEDDPRRYGLSAVAAAAQELGFSASTFYGYGLVARAWSEHDFQELAARRGGQTGLPLSFSHFIELAALEDIKVRDALMEVALGHGWTIRELRARIGRVGRPGNPPAPYPVLKSILNMSKSLIDRRAAWHESLTKLTDVEPSRELAELLESTLTAQRAIEQAFAEDAALTASALKRVRSVLVRK
jgi:hypothetical protein